MEKFYLELPSVDRKNDALEYIEEFYEYGSQIHGSGSLDKYLKKGKTYEEWVNNNLNLHDENYALEKGLVPSYTYFLVREKDDRIVGMVDLRLGLNEYLRDFGGHIGSSIRPTERRKGYNKINLYLILQVAQKHNLEKVDDNNYTLSVGKDVDSINISAIAEDNKSTITGAGEHKLVAGENEIEIVVTSESGAQNKITIKVTKKDEYSIEDLKTLLSDPKVNEIDITIDSDSILSSQDISEIKTSNKVVNLNYYDKDKKLIYSWILDGSQIEDFDNLQTSIELESKNKKEMSKLSNYAEGLYISLNHNGIIPKGTKIRLYVGDKYDNNDLVNVYYYNNDSLIKIASDLKVDNGYITFEAEKTSDYLITMSDIKNEEKITSRKITLKHILLTIGLLLLLLILCIILFIKKRKNRKKTNSLNNFNNQTYNFNDNK